ncbi:hypothetical protein SLE2022_004930 [Rubroshorea leprosula]
MALGPESAGRLEEDGERPEVEDGDDPPAHHPSAPPDELFDISTTVDPSYIISMIRKLLPTDTINSHDSHGVGAGGGDAKIQGSDVDKIEEKEFFLHKDKILNSNDGYESMGIVADLDKSDPRGGEDEDSCHKLEQPRLLAGEEVWEEYGCVLWDLAAIRTHAEIMVQNLMLDVLLANLMITEPVRVTEICLGIIGNLACHEVLMKHIISTNGLVTTIVDQLFLDDTQCLCEAFRLLTSGLQSSERATWAKALQSENILSRILWITENTLNPLLIEKSVGLILAILESQQETESILLPSLMKLGLPSLLVNLLAFEMNKLTNERMPERYAVLDVILRAIENLSAIDGYSQEICSNKELFQLVCDLVKYPDKVEVANSCVTAGVLIANILSDASDLAAEIAHDLPFLQGLLDIFPFASDDLEARRALWSAIARLLVNVQEDEISASDLREYVSVLVSKTDLIEDDLLDDQVDEKIKENGGLGICGLQSNARTIALGRIISILSQWNASKDHDEGKNDLMGEDNGNGGNIGRLLDCCRKHTKVNAE